MVASVFGCADRHEVRGSSLQHCLRILLAVSDVVDCLQTIRRALLSWVDVSPGSRFVLHDLREGAGEIWTQIWPDYLECGHVCGHVVDEDERILVKYSAL